jgi:DNA polymerase elongation subunit (family B)
MTNKILLLDIETSPNIGYTWEKYDTTVIEFVKERHLLCFTVKWLGASKSVTKSIADYPNYLKDKESDKELAKDLWEYLNEADIIIGHNAINFDLKMTNARFIVNGLLPPSPYRTIDTVKEARKRFKFNSNTLNDLSKLLGIGSKLKHAGFSLWKGCMEGDPKCWSKMKRYNKIDVDLLEKLYLRLRPWMETHPSVSIGSKTNCPACACDSTQKRGYAYARSLKYQRYQCTGCGHWFKGETIR